MALPTEIIEQISLAKQIKSLFDQKTNAEFILQQIQEQISLHELTQQEIDDLLNLVQQLQDIGLAV